MWTICKKTANLRDDRHYHVVHLKQKLSPLKPRMLYCTLIIADTSLNFGGDLVSTGELIQRLHARDAVGPLKNGFYIIANDYDVAVAA